jgi:DNA-binding transcriptional MerR regulator
MESSRVFTMSQLVKQSDFDKRTIAFYVQEGLLPRVGRRGPRTRYSEEFLDRLMFIRRLRDLQDSGRLRAVTLSEIREVIESLSAGEIRHASAEGVSEQTLREFFSDPDLDTSDVAVAGEDVALRSMRDSAALRAPSMEISRARRARGPSASMRRESMASREYSRAVPESAHVDSELPSFGDELNSELEQLLQKVEHRALIGAKRSGGGLRERLTRVPITDEIVLSVRNIEDEDAHLVEDLARLLRRIGRLD